MGKSVKQEMLDQLEGKKTYKLTDQEVQKFMDFLNAKSKDGVPGSDHVCPLCGHNQWSLSRELGLVKVMDDPPLKISLSGKYRN